MNKLIIHISDLHVTLYQKSNGVINNKIDSYLTTNSSQDESTHFIEKFSTQITSDYANCEFILVITGDISNSGEKNEFDFAYNFIKKVIDKIKILPENCLIMPGDHDVHRRSIDNELEEHPTNESHLLNNVKFKNFSELYKKIKLKEFPFNKIIIDFINIDNKIILIGINSNYKVDNEGGEGFIPIEQFKAELNALKTELNNNSHNFIVCWHHNFSAGYEDKNSGQWNPENRIHLLAELERQNIKFVFTGNEHTSNCKSILMGSITSSDCGTLTSIKYDATFKLYPIIIGNDIILENKIYALQRTNNNDTNYYWDIRNNTRATQPDTFDIFIENRQSIDAVEEIVPNESIEELAIPVKILEPESQKIIYYNNPQITEKLYNIIKSKKLFHSGHFHWSETSRAHNWIDVAKLLEDKEDLYFVQNAIIDIIQSFKLNNNCNLIIGLGYEGNIISSKASIKFNISYSSLPYSYRYNDHHHYEKKLNYENVDGKFKTVMIITDVVNDGRTIRKLIDKREKPFFDKVEKVIVLSLFYTGQENINIDILNYNKLPKGYDFENDHEINKIEYYTVKSLRVEKCPYGKNYREECFIYKDQLSCVNLFYDEKLL